MGHIKIRHLKKKLISHHGVFALDIPDLTIEKGSIICILGESGAGKTTLLRCINKLVEIDSGHVFIDGTDIQTVEKKQLQEKRKRIGMVFQQFNLISNKTVFDNVAVNMKICNEVNVEKINECLQRVGLAGMEKKFPTQLSGGERQRVAIASVLAQNPEIILLDEPVASLDYKTGASIAKILQEINKALNITIVIVSHELNFIKHLCKNAYLMEDGRIIKMLTINQSGDKSGHKDYLDHVEAFLCN